MTWNKRPTVAADDALDTDHGHLRELGYKQELKRHLSYARRLSVVSSTILISCSLLHSISRPRSQ